MTSLKVDLKNGLLEVEGEEVFVREIYGDYKDVLTMISARMGTAKDVAAPQLDAPAKGAQQKDTGKSRTRAKGSGQGKGKESHKIDSSLNLRTEGKKSFREFLAEKKPGSGQEVNAVAVYYLQKVLEIETITPDSIYTCYKDGEKKVPTALIQNLWDTASLKGWIDTADMAKIHITTAGENFVEHDLPKKAA